MVDEESLTAFVEQLGLMWERYGANRTMARMLGWLMVCDPAEQTADELAEALQVSKASVSTASRALEGMGLVERVAVPGDRRVRYRMVPGGWDITARVRIKEMVHLINLAEMAQKALADEPESRHERVDDFHDWATWWSRGYERLLEEWENRTQP